MRRTNIHINYYAQCKMHLYRLHIIYTFIDDGKKYLWFVVKTVLQNVEMFAFEINNCQTTRFWFSFTNHKYVKLLTQNHKCKHAFHRENDPFF